MNPSFFVRSIVRRLAVNSAAPLGLTIGCAVNVAAIGADDWLMLAPYGETDYWEQDGKGKWAKFNQIFTEPQAVKMASNFASTAAKKGANWRGLNVYKGHPDADPKRWPDDSRLGGIMAVEARADGLFVKVVWNDQGEKNRAEGYLVYPSPAWLHSIATQRTTGRIEPDELRSVGLTNTPRIEGVPAWTNSDPVNQAPSTQNQDLMPEIKAQLLKLLKLPDTATDAEIMTAFTAYLAEEDKEPAEMAAAKAGKASAEADALKANSDAALAKAEAEKFRKLAINSAISKAINSRKLTAAQQPAWETKLATNFDAGLAELESLAAALPNDPLALNPAQPGDLSTPYARRTAYNARLDELTGPVSAGGKGMSFNAAHNFMLTNAADAALLKSMQETTTA